MTGSAHAVLVPYWCERLGRDRLTAYQASARGGYLDCRLEGDRVVLGGACATVIEGRFLLQAASGTASVAAIVPPPSTRSPA